MHNVDFVAEIVDRIYIMKEGAMISEGASLEVLSDAAIFSES